jgi:hypothetical protein
MRIGTGVGKSVTTIFSTFPWSTTEIAQAPDWTINLSTGTIQRSGGPASTRVTFNIDVVAPNNTIPTFALFVNSIETPWAIANTSASATDVQSYALTAVVYDASATINYQMQVKSTAAGTITLSNAILVCENIPVNTN